MQKFILLFLVLTMAFHTGAQRAKGSWQDYLSYTNATKIAVANSKIYCATKGGLFFYDVQDNSINKFTQSEGLSDVGIQTIACSRETGFLIVAYSSSNIDLISETGKVSNLTDIKRKQITGNKTINNISFSGKEAFLSCGFGIVVLNLEKMEVKDTYIIGNGGAFLNVNDVEIFQNSIYAATNEGLYVADQNSPNLLDYNNWKRIENIPRATQKFSHLVVHADALIACYTPDEYSQDELYRLSGNEWTRYQPQIQYAYDIQSNGTILAATSRAEIYLVDNQHNNLGMINRYEFPGETVSSISPRSTGISSDGTIWVADNAKGMVHISGNTFETIYPNGPLDNSIFSLYANGADLWVLPGGRDDTWTNTWQSPRFQLNRNGEWTNFTKTQFPELDNFFDMVCMVTDPGDPDHIFAGSWGGGLLEFQGNQFVNRYTNRNSPLETALPNQPNEPFVRIGGLDFDSQGNLWIANSEAGKNLHKLSPSGDWESFTLPEVANSRNIGQMIVSKSDDKWIIVPRGHDIYVVDKTGAQKKHLPLISYFNNGINEIFNRMNDVYSIAEDHDGNIWIGTSKGVAVYTSPSRIWTATTFYATQPSLNLNDGLYHPLLETETVTAIAVDGANRKWLGTKSSGAYLISENGEEELLHFTQENSPLLSNSIKTIAINEKSGEVFFGTDEGLISYYGDAIGGNDGFKNVYVYPNPVRETYNGPVTISGLMEDTDVKITDISGNLVYHAQSLGGQAIWDGKNLNGNRVKTGVYLVFCNDKTGNETHITKLLFIH